MKAAFAVVASLAVLIPVHAGDVLATTGFSSCGTNDSTITVQKLNIQFDRSTNMITFDVAGTSKIVQDVTATLKVSAYGVPVYNNTFDPCSSSTKVDQLCPVPSGTFSAQGTQQIPSEYADKIPSIAYTVPDLDGDAQMILTGEGGQEVACIQSTVNNGKSVDVPGVSVVAAGIAAGALLLSGASSVVAGGKPGSTTSSPGFFEVMWWFQGIAINGMFSVNYPGIYRKWTKNFAFSTGLIPWGSMQVSIDNFRQSTGGNLTGSSYQDLQNATLRFPDGSTTTTGSSFKMAKRVTVDLIARQINGITTSSGGSTSAAATTGGQSKLVSGIQGYAEQLSVPQENTFMTVLLVFSIVIGAIVVGILLFKVILEAWALFGRYPKSLVTFRKEYWRVLAQTITNLILLLYGIWTLYCIFQFTHGDAWGPKILAGVTLAVFTAVLAFYTFKIWSTANDLKKLNGDSSALYENKETWKKYSLFYGSYRKSYWWLFVPAIIYMFAKGCVLAAGDGHGLVQTVGQLIIESLLFILLLWSRPYDRKSGNWINIIIQVVRVLSVACILVFVEELGIAQTTKTITGVVLIVVQASLTAVLAILIAINALVNCCKENPHRKRRKAAERAGLKYDPNTMTTSSRDLEGDAFLMSEQNGMKTTSQTPLSYDDMRAQQQTKRTSRYGLMRGDSQDVLVTNSADMGDVPQPPAYRSGGYSSVNQDARDHSPGHTPQDSLGGRQARLPDIDYNQGQPGRRY